VSDDVVAETAANVLASAGSLAAVGVPGPIGAVVGAALGILASIVRSVGPGRAVKVLRELKVQLEEEPGITREEMDADMAAVLLELGVEG